MLSHRFSDSRLRRFGRHSTLTFGQAVAGPGAPRWLLGQLCAIFWLLFYSLMLFTKTAVHFGSLITLLPFGRVLCRTSSFTTPASARATKTASKTPLPNVFMGWHLNPIRRIAGQKKGKEHAVQCRITNQRQRARITLRIACSSEAMVYVTA